MDPKVDALASATVQDRLVVLVFAYCGLRFGELAVLRVRNVDPLRRRLRTPHELRNTQSAVIAHRHMGRNIRNRVVGTP